MPPHARRSTKRSSCSATGSFFLLFFFVLLAGSAAAAKETPGDTFAHALDAYFGEEPYRALVLVQEAMNRPGPQALREAGLYLQGKSFASIHLYEKAEDSLRALVGEFPAGRFAPHALRELARIFFDLREFGPVVNLEQAYRGSIGGAFPPEVWYLVGQSNYLLGRKESARDALLKVAPGNPFYPFARYTLAQVEFGLARSDSALANLGAVASSPQSPALLRDKALRASGMILYQQKRYGESMRAYETIASGSSLYGPSRIDLAIAAEAASDPETVKRALTQAMDGSEDDLLRAEAQVAFGRLFTRQEKAGTARALFDEALAHLRAREGRLREAVEVDGRFREVFAELVAFARQSRAKVKSERLVEDLALLSPVAQAATGRAYRQPEIVAPQKISPRTYLFAFLQRHFHNPAIIETLVDLSVELEDLQAQLGKLESEVRDASSSFRASSPLKTSEVPDEVSQLSPQMVWLSLAHFDLISRFFDALAVAEKIDPKQSVAEKRPALAATTEALRVILFGERVIPSKESLMVMMEAARVKLASGELPGLMSTKVREGFLQEWRTDRDSLTYVVDHLGLKERQMSSALTGVPLRSRNLNLPVLTTMTDWLAALEQLVAKYRSVELQRDDRPWHLAGRGEELESMLDRAAEELGWLRERAAQILRAEAGDLIEKEQVRHSLIMAEAEEGIADALFEERSGRD